MDLKNAAVNVGDVRITPLSDGEARIPAHAYFQGSTAADWESHRDLTDENGNYVFPLGCFVIDTAGHRILVDTGIGPVDTPIAKGGRLPEELKEASIEPDSIETVVITHFHTDHVGGLVDSEDLRFLGADVVMTPEERNYWTGGDLPPSAMYRHDVMDAISSRIREAEDGELLAPGVNLIALPGHTPGSAGLVISSREERAILLGDAISCPVQLEESEWTSIADVDPELAKRTREALWREIEGSATAIGASHFPDLRLGRVLTGEGKRYFGPI